MTPTLYEDWPLLRRVDADLRLLSRRHALPLPQSQTFRRSEQVRAILRKTPQWPPSFLELAERLWADRWLPSVVWRQEACRQGVDALVRRAIVMTVCEEILFVIVRNAGTWYRNPKRLGTWQGLVYVQARNLTKRRAGEEGPDGRMRTNGWDDAA